MKRLEEMVLKINRGWRDGSALAEDPGLIPHGGSQPSLIPNPQDPRFSSDLCRDQAGTCYTHIHAGINGKINKINKSNI